MLDGLDDFVIDPATGLTVRLPSSFGIGLPRPTTSDPRSLEGAFGPRDQEPAPTPVPPPAPPPLPKAPPGEPPGQVGSGLPINNDATSAGVPDASQPLPGQPAIPPPPPVAATNLPPEQVGADLRRQGIKLAEDAATQNAQTDQMQATAEEKAITDRNAELDRIRQETQRQEAEKQKRFEELKTNVSAKTDEWAKYKVDPGRRWKNASTGRKIGATIAVAMTALGDALQHKSGPNLALEMINKAIEDDISLQVNDRQHLGEVASRARTSLDDYRREYGDWQNARSAKLAEEYKRTADEIERVGASAKGDRAKANALAIVGDLRTRAGALEQGIATSAWDREMKQAAFAEQKRAARAGEGLQWAGLKQNDRHFDEQMKFSREKLAADQKAAAAEWSAKATAEQQKALRESGLKDPTTGQYIMGGDGQPVLARNAGEAAKVQETVDGTQTMLSTIDRIKAKIANDPGFAKLNEDQKQAALSAELGSLTLLIKDAYGTGALDKGAIEFTNAYTGGDPTKLTSKGLFGALGLGSEAGENVNARLDVVAKTAETRALNRMGNPKGFKFARDEKLEQTPANKAAEQTRKGTPTTAAAVRAQEPGGIAKTLQDVESFVFGTEQQYKKDARNAQESGGSLRYPGFRADKEAALDTLVSGVQQGDAQSQTRLLEMVRDQKTPGLSEAAMTLIEAHAPGLIPAALSELPADKRSLKQSIYAARAAGGGPNIQLFPQGR